MQSSLTAQATLALISCSLMMFSHHCYLDALPQSDGRSFAYIPTPLEAQLWSIGFDEVVADFYWLLLMQYVGDTSSRSSDKYILSAKYLNVVTSLDPWFLSAYSFAAFLIGGEQGNPREADKIINGGITHNPGEWSLPFIAGVNQYLFAHNEQGASKYYRFASKFPQAPKWLSRQADILESKIPSTMKQIFVWQNIYSTSSNLIVKRRAARNLATLWRHISLNSKDSKLKARALSELRKYDSTELD